MLKIRAHSARILTVSLNVSRQQLHSQASPTPTEPVTNAHPGNLIAFESRDTLEYAL
jgi:hypothetical protein